MKRALLCLVATLITLGSAGRASAASITFTLNCTIQNLPPSNPAVCPQGGPFGTITLSDPTGPGANTNRVDVAVILYAAAMPEVRGLDNLFLNYDNSVTVGSGVNRKFGVVSQSAPVGGEHNFVADVDVNPDALGPFQTRLDISLDPDENPGLIWFGSLVLHSTLSGHAESNLDVSMFNLKDADNLFYAAVNTLPANQAQRFGATVSDAVNSAAVPEPASLVLLGSGLLGIARARRRRSR